MTLWILSSYSFFQLIFRYTTICTNSNATVGFFLFLRILAFASQTIKKLITTFTFTFLITYFNFTQLLFWILALLDLSFPAAVKNLFCIHFVHCHLHIPCFLCLFTCPTHSCTYSCSPNFHLYMLSSSFPFP